MGKEHVHRLAGGPDDLLHLYIIWEREREQKKQTSRSAGTGTNLNQITFIVTSQLQM